MELWVRGVIGVNYTVSAQCLLHCFASHWYGMAYAWGPFGYPDSWNSRTLAGVEYRFLKCFPIVWSVRFRFIEYRRDGMTLGVPVRLACLLRAGFSTYNSVRDC